VIHWYVDLVTLGFDWNFLLNVAFVVLVFDLNGVKKCLCGGGGDGESKMSR
jgi:hypothetical protein